MRESTVTSTLLQSFVLVCISVTRRAVCYLETSSLGYHSGTKTDHVKWNTVPMIRSLVEQAKEGERGQTFQMRLCRDTSHSATRHVNYMIFADAGVSIMLGSG